MEDTSIKSGVKMVNPLVTTINLWETKMSGKNNGINPRFENLIAECGEDFFYYISWLGFTKEMNLMILSSLYHYYYECSDLKSAKTLINLKMLNYIKHPDSFLHTLFRILPFKATLVGWFKEHSDSNENSVPFCQSVKSIEGLKDFLEFRTNKKMSKKEADFLLEEHGFRVMDMTDIKGITYFSSQKKG